MKIDTTKQVFQDISFSDRFPLMLTIEQEFQQENIEEFSQLMTKFVHDKCFQ